MRHREAGCGVAEAFTHDLDGDPLLEEERGVCVPQIMEAKPGHACRRHDPIEGLREGVRMDRLAARRGEDVVVISDGGIGLACSPGFPFVQDLDGEGVEVDRTTGRTGLAWGIVEHIAHRDERPADREPLGPKVDIAPAEAQQLGASHTGCRRQPIRREQTLGPCDGQESLQLLHVPGPKRRVGPTTFGRFGVFGNVVDDQATAASVGQRLAQDDVDFKNGLRVQTAGSVPSTAHQKFGVQRLQLLGGEAASTRRSQGVVLREARSAAGSRATCSAGGSPPWLAATGVASRWRG
jgi:hypothetical protein